MYWAALLPAIFIEWDLPKITIENTGKDMKYTGKGLNLFGRQTEKVLKDEN